jgi:DNA polymerase
MFVGEGPGFNEDKQGRPFVGAAGQFLNELLASIGLRREDVFITNMVKCRPPNNRDPFPGELDACTHYLDEQIAEIQPKIIVPLGRHALSHWFPNESIGRVRAKPKRIGNVTLFPLYHPAAALHNGGLRATIEEDFGKLGALLASLNQAQADTPTVAQVGLLDRPEVQESGPRSQTPREQPAPEPPPDEPPAQQLSMF